MFWPPSRDNTSQFRYLVVSSLILYFVETNHQRRMTSATSSCLRCNTDIVSSSSLENVSKSQQEWLARSDWTGSGFDWTLSTEENYRSVNHEFCGSFKQIRERLDYNYHGHYSCGRQILQDFIIQSMLDATQQTIPCRCHASPHPWVVFTAGVMGAGKSFTVRRLDEQGLFPLHTFVVVDPDEIRRLLPEFSIYLRHSAENAGALTRKEAGMMAEILSEAALERGQNVLKDGSLRDADWYKNYFAELRKSFPGIRLGIIHVTAPLDVILERVHERAKQTGRIVPRAVLAATAKQVPVSVRILKAYVDFFLEIDNSIQEDGTGTVVTRGMSISDVKENFVQRCPDHTVEKGQGIMES